MSAKIAEGIIKNSTLNVSSDGCHVACNLNFIKYTIKMEEHRKNIFITVL